MNLDKAKSTAPVILRIGLSLVFLWFGINQLLYPLNWIGWVPGFASSTIDPFTIVFVNGISEIVFGVLLLIGLYTRIASFLLALHMLGITLSVGWNEIGVRDFGILMALISVFLHGADDYCLDKKLRKNRSIVKANFLK
ncbi:DoxX family protein [Candidatus Pacearchaeota archaeon]|nr:DoxX family protein [Candidatus Pacearchaeota archaeon]